MYTEITILLQLFSVIVCYFCYEAGRSLCQRGHAQLSLEVTFQVPFCSSTCTGGAFSSTTGAKAALALGQLTLCGGV